VGAKDESRKLLYHGFLEDLIVMVAPGTYPDSITMEEMKRYPLIVREAGSGTRQCFDMSAKKKGLAATDLNIVAELGDTQAVKEAVKKGWGWHICRGAPLPRTSQVRRSSAHSRRDAGHKAILLCGPRRQARHPRWRLSSKR
jgi:hypothetical protein